MTKSFTQKVFIPMLEKSLEIPSEIIQLADKRNVYIPHYAEIISEAFNALEFVRSDYKNRIMSRKKFWNYLIEAIATFQGSNFSPEQILIYVDDYTYDDYLNLFEECGCPVKWYRIYTK